ncbi:hypothetical protein BS47DRAFT_1394832 [Hydnum rufescens UP504]|uniref:Uncharacterized protein n=1 Tax=Hydnum rufescens UP504 TaxID=1448309 RepID=A0A9P6ATQ7_9AGAM|nr:hypothetical protein BS47DRAFT_1394832 [Hydnum rufescens UP504]
MESLTIYIPMAQSQSPTIRSLPSSYSTHGGEDLTISHRYLSIELLPGPVFFPPSDRVNTVGSTVIDSSSPPYSRPASPLFTQKTIPDIPSQICNDCGSHSLRCVTSAEFTDALALRPKYR